MVGVGVLQELLMTHRPKDSFYVYDLDVLTQAYEEWKRAFPTVIPYYAVKCNPDPVLVKHLAGLGASFDCATPAEFNLVLELGVEPERIIYANPCKRPEDIQAGMKKMIQRTTFDSVCELQKIALATTGRMKVLLRIRADDPTARCNLGNKYGAEEEDWPVLLSMCSRLSLDLVGISFHVGSMAGSADAFVEALAKARKAVTMAETYGFKPRIIDIGGGFSSNNVFDLGPVPSMINQALNLNFNSEFKFIAEPGRYFAEHTVTLLTPVIGVKNGGVTISESLYGAFNCILFDHARPSFYVLNADTTQKTKVITMFGSTCDGGDVIYKECHVPFSISFGNWIVWPRMGAYTSAATTRFNGIPFDTRQKIYIGQYK
jgi:ornithine decarboxylase